MKIQSFIYCLLFVIILLYATNCITKFGMIVNGFSAGIWFTLFIKSLKED